MLVARRFAFSAAQTRHISVLGVGKELELGVDFSCTLCIKFLFTVKDCLTLGMVFKKIIRNKGVGFVCTSVVNRTLPAVTAVFGNCVAGTRLDTFTAVVAKALRYWSVCFKRQVCPI